MGPTPVDEPATELLIDALKALRADDNAPVYVQIERCISASGLHDFISRHFQNLTQ